MLQTIRRLEFISLNFGARPSDGHQVLNGARLLTRILPVLFENPDDEFQERVFWKNEIPRARTDGREEESDELHWEPAPANLQPPPFPKQEERPEPVPVHEAVLGRALLHSLNRLLFAQGFTVDATAFRIFANRYREIHERVHTQEEQEEGRTDVDLTDEGAQGEEGEEGEEDAPPPAPSRAPASAPVRSLQPHESDSEEVSRFVPSLSNSVWPSILWNGGVGFPHLHPPQSGTYDANRVDLLRLFMACLSPTLFVEPDVERPVHNQFLDEAVAPDVPLGPTLFYSLLNTVLSYDPIGWGVPYASAMMSDSREPLLDMSLQVLLLLLDYGRPGASVSHPGETAEERRAEEAVAEGEGGGGGGESAQPPVPAGAATPGPESGLDPRRAPNVYRSLLAGLRSKADFTMIYRGITRLMNNVHESQSTLLPYAVKQVACYQELLVLLWKLLDENRRFTVHVLQEEPLGEVLVPILYYMWRDRKNPARVGLLHIGTFILLLLSGYRDFGVALNESFDRTLPLKDMPVFHGSHADLLVIVLHKLIVDGSRRLSTLYSCFLTITANVSPYCKGLTMVSAVKLINLFEVFSRPRFLFASPEHPPLIAQLLEVFNNLLQYQYDGSVNVVYGLVRQHDLFESLVQLRAPEDRSPQPPPSPSRAAPTPEEGAEGEQEEGGEAGEHGGDEDGGAGGGGGEAGGGGGEGGERKEEAARRARAEQPVTTAHEHGVAPHTKAKPSQPPPDTSAPSSPKSGEGAVGHAGAETASLPDSAAMSALWRPTNSWVEAWKRELPLYTVMTALRHLTPRVTEFVHASNGAVDEETVLDFLRKTTLVGLLPQPHPIVTRRHEPNEFTALWFSTFLWGVIYLRNLELPIFDARRIRLFSLTLV